MDTLEAIATRRSVRCFTSEVIKSDVIEKILQSAMNAPSASNQQPWHFLVINDRKILDQIPEVHPFAQMCIQASLAIVVCIDINARRYKEHWPQDLSAASQNILLASRALGLGAVWVGLYPLQKRVIAIQKLLNLSSNIIPFNVIPLGYTEIKQERQSRYNKNRIHYNKW